MHEKRGSEHDERRVLEDGERDVVFNEADRALARHIVAEVKKQLGIKDVVQYRDEQKLLKQILPMLETMHDTYKWKHDLYGWWFTTMGKTVAWGATTFLFFCIVYGGSQAVRTMIARATG